MERILAFWKTWLTLSLLLVASDHGTARSVEENSVGWWNRIHLTDEELIQCKDTQGKDIKWYVAYKLAKIPNAEDPFVRRGIGYIFLTPTAQHWTLANHSVNDTSSLPARTIERAFKNEGKKIVVVAYNDQPPDDPPVFGNGHAKGVILANQNGGIWLQHSVPKFPKLSQSTYSYPWTGAPNGQIFFCMTLTKDQIESGVTGILQVTRPHVFNFTFPALLVKEYPKLHKLVSGKKLRKRKNKRGERVGRVLKADDSAVFRMKVDEGIDMTVFAKSPAHHTDVYADWIAPTLKSGLEVQSWLNGPNPLPSNCTLTSFVVKNIVNKTLDGYGFSTHSDHSKWAVGDEQDWMCISDLNRMKHQEERGGATFCFRNTVLWNNFKNGIQKLEPCSGPGGRLPLMAQK